MHLIRRSCQLVVRNSHGAAVYANGSRRAFSRSVARSKGGLPVFTEPSSIDLSSALTKINSKLLFPRHLTKEQQNLVYKGSNRPKLEAEPVEVTIGDVTLPLQHIHWSTRPSQWKSLRKVVNHSKTAADWANVVRLLEGYHSAGIPIRPEWQELVVRKLNETGHHSLVLKALQRVKATGLRLSNYSVTVRVLSGAHERAADADWDMEETSKALRYARQVVELMEEEDHHAVPSVKGDAKVPTDWRSAPFVIAIPTELAAIVAQKHGGDVEIVKTFANRLVNALKQGSAAVKPQSHEPSAVEAQDEIDRIATLAKQSESDFKGIGPQINALNLYFQKLYESLIIWSAVRTSRAALGVDMPLAAEAAEYESRIKNVLDGSVEAFARLQTRNSEQLKSRYPAYFKEQYQKCQG